jgi:M-phase inducer tyrosine phosphatase
MKNIDRYPLLCYPEVYVLEGGYSGFVESGLDYCEGGYIRMDDDNYKL